MKRVEKAGSVCRTRSVLAYVLRIVTLAGALLLALLPGTAAAQTGGISGNITDAVTGTGLSTTVRIYNWHGVNVAAVASVAGTGAYVVTNLPAGIYFMRTFAASNYNDEAYNNVFCEICPITTTEPITVNAGVTTPNINLALSTVGGGPATGSISGTVIDTVTGLPISGVLMGIFPLLGPTSLGSGIGVNTDAAGNYTLTGLGAGTYVVMTFLSTTSIYLNEGYNNVSCPNGGGACSTAALTPITVGAGATGNINFSLQPGGAISGTVTDQGTAAALAGVSVQISTSTGSFIKATTTDAAGAYSVVGLAPGTYYARTVVGSLNYLDEAYNNFTCFPSCTITTSTPITVAGTATTPNINFPLSPGGGITGTVSDGSSGLPISGVTVQVFTSTGAFAKSTSSDVTGVYTVVGLSPGNYFARTFVPSSINNQDEAYNNIPCSPTCTITATTPITVAGTAITPGISFALPIGGTITGSVTDARTGAPGISLGVQIFSSTGVNVKTGFTDSTGVYSVRGLPTGTYYARTQLTTNYVSELYNNINCPHNACSVVTGAPIAVAVGTTQGSINFPLVPAGAADLTVDFGPGTGLWMLPADGSWRSIHSLSPVATVNGDFDGNGRDDLVVNFGPGIGVYAWMNHSTWTFVHPASPTQMVTGDFDDNGRDEAVFAFAGAGIWRWSDGSFSQLHGLTPSRLAVGRVNAVVGDDLVVDFPGVGIWLFANNVWSQLHSLNSVGIVTADLNGNFRDEVVVTFAGAGVWVYRDTGAWTQLHTLIPVRIAVGHLDTGTREDLVVDFGGPGVWTYRNDATWAQLHTLSTQGIVVVDRDVTLSDEIILDFGAAGMWQFASNGTWSPLHYLSPEDMGSGRFR